MVILWLAKINNFIPLTDGGLFKFSLSQPVRIIAHWIIYNMHDRGPQSGVRASGNWLFFVREFVKMKKYVREFVKTMSFVIREKEKYRSWIREIWNICSWIREFRYIRDSWFDKITFVKSWNPHFLHLTNRYRTPVPMGTKHTVEVLGQGRVGNC